MKRCVHTIQQLVNQLEIYYDTGIVDKHQQLITEKVIKGELQMSKIKNVDVMYALLDGLETLVNFDGFDPAVDALRNMADDLFYAMNGMPSDNEPEKDSEEF